MPINKDNLRLIFVILYIVGDLFYVSMSKSVYDEAVIKIQGNPMPSSTTRYIAAASAWFCMAIGWYFLTSQVTELWIRKGVQPILAGFLAGLINGLAVIGTFNLTLYAMMNKWEGAIMIRDMIWGIGWVTVLTIFYALLV
jgi:uncharacterized membrane protein